MTSEEMERAIEFLLQGQANFETRLEQTNQQIAETNRQLQITAETQTEFIQFVTRHLEAQAEINASLRSSIRSLRGPIRELTAAQARTDERLDRLAATVERFISEGRNGNSQQ
jgi:prefoldin subunit 5